MDNDPASGCVPARPAQAYIIASTPRTGSYLLCEGLEATGVAGRPSEVFCPVFQYVWLRRWSLPAGVGFSRYFQAAIKHLTTANGICGVKIHWMQLEPLARYAGMAGEPERILGHLFPGAKYVHLFRRDTRAQAISYFRAFATNEWWRIDGVHNYQITGQTPAFDADAIATVERYLIAQEQSWQRYLDGHGAEPLVIEYETLAGDYRAQIARVLEFLGLDVAAAASIPPPRLRRQADGITEQWCAELSRQQHPIG